VSGPANQALRAWLRLEELGIPWRPNEALIGLSDADIAAQIIALRDHNIGLDAVLQRVTARGGPAAPWKVDLRARSASLGDSFEVHFYALSDGGFSPSTYRRTDRPADYGRDKLLIEDAVACIAEAIRKAGPHWLHDRSIACAAKATEFVRSAKASDEAFLDWRCHNAPPPANATARR
jgi:hypothetical protein